MQDGYQEDNLQIGQQEVVYKQSPLKAESTENQPRKPKFIVYQSQHELLAEKSTGYKVQTLT